MKTSMKIKGLLMVGLSFLFASNVNAQTKDDSILGDPTNYDQGFKLGFGVNAGYVPNDPFGFALGGDVRLQYDFSRKTSVTLTTGFTNFFVSGDDLGIIPVKGGFKYFFFEDQFYALGEIGIAIPVTNGYNDVIDNSLILSPGVGYATKFVDVSLRYEHYSDIPDSSGDNGIGQFAVRLAYGFRL